MTGLEDLTRETRTAGMAAVSAAATGEKPWPDFVESLKDLSAQELSDALTGLDAKAAKTPRDFAQRVALVYAIALQRDTTYSLAAGRWHYALGINAALRSLYEGGRTYLDATT